VGADIESVRFGMGSDTRIGKRFLFAGIGYGGSCFPKDVRALMYSADAANTPLDILKAVYSVNAKQIQRFNQKISNHFNNDLKGKKFAIWGLAFKPNTDDTREAPAFSIIEFLLGKGASVSAYDPEAMENTKKKFGVSIEYVADMYDALQDADALIVPTEWGVFRRPEFEKIKEMLKSPVLFDGRNIYSPEEMKELGFIYYCIGRKC
jgi:UDPglucose 6-dehydrogenase